MSAASRLRCLATTGSLSVSTSKLFREAQFSADGSTLVTHTDGWTLRTFVLPPDLLETKDRATGLEEYASFRSPTSVTSYAPYPGFDLQDTSTTLVLSASTNLPISLINALDYDFVHAKYPFVHPATEEYITPYSLTWTPNGSHFIAGSKDHIAIFDSSYDGSGPVVSRKTSPSRYEKKLVNAGSAMIGCRGIVSALSISSDRMLAAGSFDRQVALYGGEGRGECMTAFSVAGEPGTNEVWKGKGITQLAWSPCGTYVLVAERASDVVQVYDVRKTLRQLAWLGGRKASTMQRLGIDLVPTSDGYEVWAGGVDGCVRMWKDPGSSEGDQRPDETVQLHGDPVSSCIWHPQGSVLATCSGRRQYAPPSKDDVDDVRKSNDEDNPKPLENVLKIWAT